MTDLNEIVTGNVETPILDLDMHCPKLVTCGLKRKKVNNWSVLQCKLRIELGNACTKNCRIGRIIREEMLRTGQKVAEEIVKEEKF